MDMVSNAGNLALQQATNAALSASTASANPDVDKAAQDFEGMFLSQMLQPMFETVKVDPLFGGGHGEEVMRGFMIQEYGKVLAKQGGFGIAAYVKSAMLEAQSKANAAAGKRRQLGIGDTNTATTSNGAIQ